MSDTLIINKRSFRPRLPGFLKQELPQGPAFQAVRESIGRYRLKTVCEEAKCPNRTHCYNRGTLTFQILGSVCTRSCGFCAETFGRPSAPPDPDEPLRIVEAAERLKLKHVVVTSPARDDLADDGAGHFAAVVNEFRKRLPHVTVEVLIPDFRGRKECLDVVFQAKPDVFNHNIETIRRLTPRVRSRATYERTLSVLESAVGRGLETKSGFMVGHGETTSELHETLADLKKAGVSLVTIGQYLPPSPRHLPLIKIYLPQEFAQLREAALGIGFTNVFAGPLVRSSFHAEEMI